MSASSTSQILTPVAGLKVGNVLPLQDACHSLSIKICGQVESGSRLCLTADTLIHNTRKVTGTARPNASDCLAPCRTLPAAAELAILCGAPLTLVCLISWTLAGWGSGRAGIPSVTPFSIIPFRAILGQHSDCSAYPTVSTLPLVFYKNVELLPPRTGVEGSPTPPLSNIKGPYLSGTLSFCSTLETSCSMYHI